MWTKFVLAALFCFSISGQAQAQILFATADVTIPAKETKLPLTPQFLSGSNSPQIVCTLYFASEDYDRPIKKGAQFMVQPRSRETINLQTCSVKTLREEIYRSFGRELPAALETRESIEQHVSTVWGHTILNTTIHRLKAEVTSTASGDVSTLECERAQNFSTRDALLAISLSGQFSIPRDF